MSKESRRRHADQQALSQFCHPPLKGCEPKDDAGCNPPGLPPVKSAPPHPSPLSPDNSCPPAETGRKTPPALSAQDSPAVRPFSPDSDKTGRPCQIPLCFCVSGGDFFTIIHHYEADLQSVILSYFTISRSFPKTPGQYTIHPLIIWGITINSITNAATTK